MDENNKTGIAWINFILLVFELSKGKYPYLIIQKKTGHSKAHWPVQTRLKTMGPTSYSCTVIPNLNPPFFLEALLKCQIINTKFMAKLSRPITHSRAVCLGNST